MIKAVLIDIDNTLLDFTECSHRAMIQTFEDFSLPYEEYMFEIFTRINNGLWEKLERGELDRETLFKTRWGIIFGELGIEQDGEAFEKVFHRYLDWSREPVEGAKELLSYLHAKYPIYAASNARQAQQLMRLESAGMLSYINEVFTSERAGHQKPSKEFFDYCFLRMGKVSPDETIIIGDSITADIGGGRDYGLKTCWFNYAHLPAPDFLPDYTVDSLREIMEIL